jgi:transposase
VSGANRPSDLQALLEHVACLEEQLGKTRGELALAVAELKRKERIIEGLQHRLFGKGSERLDPAQLQLLFDELVLGKPAPPPQQGAGGPSAPGEAGASAARSRRTKAGRFPENLPVVIEEVIVPAEVQADPGQWEEIGEEHHDELDVTRPRMFWRRKVTKKFKHKQDKSRPPLKAPAPLPSIPGTRCAPGLASQIVVDKHEDHLPHNRQSRRFGRRQGVNLGRQTLNAWSHATADHLRPLGGAMKLELRGARELVADETPLDYLDPGHGKTKQGYFWVYHDPGGRNTLFDWQLGRGHDCLLDIIGYDPETATTCFRGIVQCDGYSAYEAFVARYCGVRLAGCLAHIRRKFVAAMKDAPETVLPVLLLIQRIYFIEKQMRLAGTPETCRGLVRRARTRLLAAELHALLLDHRSQHLSQGAVGEAITYALNQWDKFLVCLEDGRLELDTNFVERAIRPAKLGLRNWTFLGSPQAGHDAALFYSLLATCRNHGLDPEVYLAEVIKRLPHNATVEQAAALTPARFAAALAAGEIQVAA